MYRVGKIFFRITLLKINDDELFGYLYGPYRYIKQFAKHQVKNTVAYLVPPFCFQCFM